jgi:hypothetical protein
MIRVKGHVEVCVDDEELANAILRRLCTDDYLGQHFDDAGCDLTTYEGNVYLEGELVSSNTRTSSLVDAYNVLKYGRRLTK